MSQADDDHDAIEVRDEQHALAEDRHRKNRSEQRLHALHSVRALTKKLHATLTTSTARLAAHEAMLAAQTETLDDASLQTCLVGSIQVCDTILDEITALADDASDAIEEIGLAKKVEILGAPASPAAPKVLADAEDGEIVPAQGSNDGEDHYAEATTVEDPTTGC